MLGGGKYYIIWTHKSSSANAASKRYYGYGEPIPPQGQSVISTQTLFHQKSYTSCKWIVSPLKESWLRHDFRCLLRDAYNMIRRWNLCLSNTYTGPSKVSSVIGRVNKICFERYYYGFRVCTRFTTYSYETKISVWKYRKRYECLLSNKVEEFELCKTIGWKRGGGGRL